ncbi:tRNA (adenosine(37)-N6)-threonylcarbamoyltransferase complex ATPase subunit type 1 TsaE [Solimonas sp. C16B3]|uniref:tRNA threonylcarbamoyladenosine biosynthesis protein TsaE n=1 Tax=Solimonas marina TaxID=2714601 RepID=A0A969WBX1_9GAMM|nr:tRNA (adenosine(37)-N6)-threonylcarbamoyltransferase complex ATPase subunit type 1 TsaE [Solimonas marina]
MCECELADAAATERAGAALSVWMQRGSGGLIYLCGDLGAGKTTLARGLLRALGVSGPIRSPSYTLIEPYTVGGRTVLHLDLYRLRDADEIEGLGLRDYPLTQCWWLVEWPEHGDGYLPPADLRITLQAEGAGRILRAQGRAGADLSSLRAEMGAAVRIASK